MEGDNYSPSDGEYVDPPPVFYHYRVIIPEEYYYLDPDPPIFLLPPTDGATDSTPFQDANNSSRPNNFTTENFPRTRLYSRCGVPGVCDFGAAVPFCLNITVAECPACNSTASGFFIFIILCLGLAIIAGNLLVILVLAQLRKKRTAKPIDWYKASLALADVIAGEPSLKSDLTALKHFVLALYVTMYASCVKNIFLSIYKVFGIYYCLAQVYCSPQVLDS